ncbi:MAG: hypothetical protein DWP94_13090 [Flavobacterium sp.]|nr:MAG: hypothetical protein DWP94_13090 [Flavobacterium sp.]
MNKIILLFFIGLSFYSCKQNSSVGFGTNAENAVNEKTLDSINREKQRIHMEMVEAGQEKMKILVQNKIDDYKVQLQSARQELDEINKFQFGRLQSEKNQQLASQRAVINDIEAMIRGYQNVLPKLGVYKTFDFNSTPEQLLNELFRASRNRDFTNFQYLVDPYAEGDGDIMMLSVIDGMPSSSKNQIALEFENGRIMGQVQYMSEDKAVAEIAIGPASTRLEKITMIKRMGSWYLYSL